MTSVNHSLKHPFKVCGFLVSKILLFVHHKVNKTDSLPCCPLIGAKNENSVIQTLSCPSSCCFTFLMCLSCLQMQNHKCSVVPSDRQDTMNPSSPFCACHMSVHRHGSVHHPPLELCPAFLCGLYSDLRLPPGDGSAASATLTSEGLLGTFTLGADRLTLYLLKSL